MTPVEPYSSAPPLPARWRDGVGYLWAGWGAIEPLTGDGHAQVAQQSSKVLLKRLSSSVAEGEAPSFADPGARSGYTRRRMKHRSAQVVKRCLALLVRGYSVWNPAGK